MINVVEKLNKRGEGTGLPGELLRFWQTIKKLSR
jgi:hypothetical protein